MPRHDAWVSKTLAASASRNANGAGSFVYVGGFDQAVVYLDITALTAVTTLDLELEVSPSGEADTDHDVEGIGTTLTFTQKTATGRHALVLGGGCPLGPYVRAKWLIGGAAHTLTFAVVIAGKALCERSLQVLGVD